jgi:type IV/VI secretion system ImpK/VasF family protein
MSVDILYDLACRHFFLLCGQVRARDFESSAEVLRLQMKQRIDTLLEQFDAHEFLSEKRSLVEYALVASADEAVLSVADALSEQWLLKPLQLERFNEYHAGSGFFIRLAALRKSHRPDETLIHLYWLCLRHGFEGELILASALAREEFMSGLYSELKKIPVWFDAPEERVGAVGFSKSDLKTLTLFGFALVCLGIASVIY